MADSRHMWRVIENLLNNVFKYALENTRVYMDLITEKNENGEQVIFSIKNISANELNINADELTERFIRGDVLKKYGRKRTWALHCQKSYSCTEWPVQKSFWTEIFSKSF